MAQSQHITRWLSEHRVLLGKFAFELIIVFVGVSAAFALENLRQEREQAKYVADMVAALRPTFDDVISHSAEIDHSIQTALTQFQAARARGERVAPPIYREGGAERPPSRAWDAVVATGVAKALDPKLFFRLTLFYNRLESFGERYMRYNVFTEQRVLAAGPDANVFYDERSGELRPEYSAYVERLRELRDVNRDLIARATELQVELAKTAR